MALAWRTRGGYVADDVAQTGFKTRAKLSRRISDRTVTTCRASSSSQTRRRARAEGGSSSETSSEARRGDGYCRGAGEIERGRSYEANAPTYWAGERPWRALHEGLMAAVKFLHGEEAKLRGKMN